MPSSKYKASSTREHWHILGAGALGCLWGFHASAGGLAITLLLRNASRLAQFTAAGGIGLVADEDTTVQTCQAISVDALDESIEQLLICCKAPQTVAAFTQVANHLGNNATVLLLQNGMGAAQELLAIKPDLQLYCAVSTDGAHLPAPFRVRRAGSGINLVGRFPRDSSLAASRQLCERLQVPGLTLQPCADIALAQWHKLAVNAIVNPLTVLFNCKNGALLDNPAALDHIAAMVQEIARVSHAMDIDLSAAEIHASVLTVCRQTGGNISSMLQDIRAQRGTEIDYINGYVQRCALQRGITARHNQLLIDKVKRLERVIFDPRTR
jgi:2-dehydropantoate 2-reductase